MLIPKKNKNLSSLKNWRPTSLLNIILKKIATTPLNSYIKGRFISENIQLISDILFILQQSKIYYGGYGIALFIEFEKTFDCLEWKYLLKVLDTCIFHFGHGFNNLAKMLYRNISRVFRLRYVKQENRSFHQILWTDISNTQ